MFVQKIAFAAALMIAVRSQGETSEGEGWDGDTTTWEGEADTWDGDTTTWDPEAGDGEWGGDAEWGVETTEWDTEPADAEWGGEEDWGMNDWETEDGDAEWGVETTEWDGSDEAGPDSAGSDSGVPGLDIREPTEEEAMILGGRIMGCVSDTQQICMAQMTLPAEQRMMTDEDCYDTAVMQGCSEVVSMLWAHETGQLDDAMADVIEMMVDGFTM